MSNRLRTIISGFLASTLIVTSLPFAALSEEIPDTAADTQIIISTDIPDAEDTDIPADDSVVEDTDTPAGDSVVEGSDTPAGDSVVEGSDTPADDSVVEGSDTPADDSVVEDTVPSTEEIETPDSSQDLTDEQQAALDTLPEGFSSEIVAFAMMRSSSCGHTSLYVWDKVDYDSCTYTSLNDEKHLVTYKITQRQLSCNDCGETLQVIDVNKTVSEERSHGWSNWDTGADNIVECYDCGLTITVEYPCSHKSLAFAESGNAYCPECYASIVLNPTQTYCDHSNYTVYYPEVAHSYYSQWNAEQHLKTTSISIYEDTSWGIDATCNDCGIWIVCDANGDIDYYGNTDRISWESEDTSILESHTFANGVCQQCGYEEVTCKHEETEAVENADKRVSVAERVDGDKHKIVTTQYYDLYCKSCKEYVGEGDKVVTSREDAHSFDAQNVCTVCGYGETCTHSSAEYSHYTTGGTFTGYEWTGNGDTHYVISYDVLAECYYCYGCGMVYIPAEGDSGAVNEQDFVSSDFALRERSRYTADCYMTNGWTQDYYSCNYCGHVKGEVAPDTCDHSAGNYEDVLDESVAPVYSNIHEDTHCVQYSYKRYCKDCGEYIKNVVNEGLEPIPHDFSNGDTCACGYVKDEEVCDHSAGNYEDILDESVALVYSNVHEDTHCVQHSYKRYCKDCGEYIKNVVDEGLEPIPHDFSNGNTCVCGYEKAENNEIVFIHPNNGAVMPIAKEINVSWKPVADADGYVYTAVAHSHAWGYANIRVDSESFTIEKECTYYETGIDITVSAWKGIYGEHEIIATETITVYVEEDQCTKYGHTLDAGYYREKHPHNKILTCTVCGHTYTLDEYGYFTDCLDCICAHDEGYTIEEHPHKYAYCKKCKKRVETAKDLRMVGKFSDCNECFSIDGYTQDRAYELALMAQEAYNMEQFGTGTTLNRWEISDDNRVNFGNSEYPTTEALITTSLTADGKLVVTIAFEGSQDLADDWVRDAVATAQNGVHGGVYNAMERFIQQYVNNEKEHMTVSLQNTSGNIEGPYSLQQLLDAVKNTPGARLCISGHSYGGALAQYFTYYAIEEFGISPDKIETYTFASLVPFTDDFILNHRELQESNIFNFIDIRDLVPDVGVTAEEELSICLSDGHWEKLLTDSVFWNSIYENLDVLLDRSEGDPAAIGGFNRFGCNIGTNIYMDSDVDAGVIATLMNIHDINQYINLLKWKNNAVVGELNALDIVAQKVAQEILQQMGN